MAMRFDEVITKPIGTLLRRESWPGHWWVQISCTHGGCAALRHTAISTGRGPFGDVSIGDHIDMVSLSFDAACAHDWTVIDVPPINVATFDPGVIHYGDHAVFVDGHLIFVDEQPDIPGREITVLDLRWEVM
jgi:hypothetical protein